MFIADHWNICQT